MELARRSLQVLFVVILSRLDQVFAHNETHIRTRDTEILKKFVHLRENSYQLGVDPCYNFHEHTCGRAREHSTHIIGKEEWKEKMREELKSLVEEPIHGEIDSPVATKIKTQYRLCMNNESREKDGTTTLKWLLTQKQDDWPMLMNNREWNAETLKLLESQKYEPSLFSIRVNDHQIYIDQYDISAYGRYLPNSKLVARIEDRELYKKTLTRMLKTASIQSNTNHSIVDSDLTDVMNFRDDLHRIAAYRILRRTRKIEHVGMTVRELQNLVVVNQTDTVAGRIKWLPFLQDVFKSVSNFHVDESIVLQVDATYITNLMNLLMEYEDRTIANHIKLHFFETYAKETSGEMEKLSYALSQAAHKTTTPPERSDSCLTQPYLFPAFNFLYLNKWFPKRSRVKAGNMMIDMKFAFLDRVKDSTMLNAKQKIRIQEEIHQVTVIIGSLEKYAKYTNLIPLYEYEVGENYLLSLVNAHRAFKDYEYSTIRKRQNVILNELPVLQGDPYYSVENSIIKLPMGYLYRMGFSSTLPRVYSYATLGQELSLLLNEIVIRRGFDSFKFDSTKPWYNSTDDDAFTKICECFRKQYDSQYARELSTSVLYVRTDGAKTLEHNLYDNAAFAIAHSAYRNSEYWDREYETLFLNYYAYTYCNYKVNFTNHQMMTQVEHLCPKSVRLNKLMANFDGFRRIFHCGEETPMAPHTRCKFWD